MYDVTGARTDNFSHSDDLVHHEDVLTTSTAFLRRFEKRRTFLADFLTVTATLADPSGVCGKNKQGT